VLVSGPAAVTSFDVVCRRLRPRGVIPFRRGGAPPVGFVEKCATLWLRCEAVALVFGKYEKIRRLAQGGMGEVFLARQTGVLDRLAILKALRPELVAEREFVDQFLDEARVAATLNHPNIVAIYDVGEWSNTYYIAMEYIAGEDLSKVWYAAAKAGIGLPFQVTVRIIMEAALGLDHAHRAKDVRGRPLNIVHRDVSPQNIMVRVDGVTKLVDFGIAKAANKASRTQAGMVKGKLQYMSPEQVRGEQLDGRSDQFSLGIVLWEMCTGRRLFKADNEINTLQKILQTPIPKPSQFVPGFPAELEAVIMRMLERDPARRYGALGEMALKLKDYLDRSAVQSGELGVAAFIQQILGKELEERTRDLTPMEPSGSTPSAPAPTTPPPPAPPPPASASLASPASSAPATPRKPSPSFRRPAPTPEPPTTAADPDDRDAPTLIVSADVRPDRRRPEDERPVVPAAGATRPAGRPAATRDARVDVGDNDGNARGDALAGLSTGPRGEWAVRRVDGSLLQFHEWAKLQQWIVDGRLLPDDQISSDGRRFWALGDDPQLAGFFSTAAAARRPATSSSTSTPSSSASSPPGPGMPGGPAAGQPGLPEVVTLVGVPPDLGIPTNTGEGIAAAVDATLPGDEPVPDFFGDQADLPASTAGDPLAVPATDPGGGGAADPLAPAPTAAFSLGALPQAMTGQWQIGGDARQALAASVDPAFSRPPARRIPVVVLGALGVVGAVVVVGVALFVVAPDLFRATLQGSPASTTAVVPAPLSTTTPSSAGGPATTGDAGVPAGENGAATTVDAGVAAATTATETRPTTATTTTTTTTPTTTATTEAKPTTPTTETKPADPPKPAPVVETYESALQKAQKAQRAGRTGEAARMFKLALDKKPDDNVAQLGLSWSNIDLGKHDAAANGFRAVLARDAGVAEAQFGLGEALRAAGRTTDAIGAYQKYLEMAPDGPDAETAKNAINALQ
jgi:serine/threonine protein kinase